MWLTSVALVLCGICFVSSAEEPLVWWETAVIYQVYPRSFKDSDGNGVGDLRGITKMADYFKEIGVDAIWLSPINKSPMKDFGYDISDFKSIDPIFGSMDDYKTLVAKLRSLDIKLLLDFVPNHTSDQHEWFKMSVNTSHPLHQFYRDFYVWHNGSGNTTEGVPKPPNNWISVFSGSAWEWSPERGQFYLHKFATEQPDLNYRNPAVVRNMTDVIDFWLDNGIDGFRMDAVQQLFEDEQFRDEPIQPGTSGDTYANLQHIYEMNHNDTFTLLKTWATHIYKRVEVDKRPRAVLFEVYDTIPVATKYYCTGPERLAFPFNFNLLMQGNFTIRPRELKRLIDDWMKSMPANDSVANWVIGNHDQGRIADRYGPEMIDAMNLVTSVLPGIKVTYYGEEIGMRNTYIRFDQTVDPQGRNLGPYHYQEGSRDPERSPMQWDDSISAGFSNNATSWLPVNPNYWWLNVAAQRAAPVSHLKVFQAMAKARRDPVLQRGKLDVSVPFEDTLLIVRSYNGSYFIFVANMGSKPTMYTSNNLLNNYGLDMNLTVVVSTYNNHYVQGFNFYQGRVNLTLRPNGAILLKSGLSPWTGSNANRLLGPVIVIWLLAFIILRSC